MASVEHENFKALLGKIVSVPRDVIKQRLEDDKATKDWTKAKGQKQERPRPIVSLDPAETSKSRS
jgi:hypothetical protein